MTRFELPYMDIRVRCSRGTYIRSLAAEIGEELHSGAYLTALRRTRSGGFRVEDALNLDFFSKSCHNVKQNPENNVVYFDMCVFPDIVKS